MRKRNSRAAHQPSPVLGLQPLLGHAVMHLHGSVSRSNLSKKYARQAHHKTAARTANHAKTKGSSMTISSAC